MKCWTILALLVAVCAVFLGVGHTEETADDFREAALEDAYSDTENDVQLADSLKNPENDDDDDDDNDDDDDDDHDNDEAENAFDSVNETPSNDEDEPEMFKRAPSRRRRRRRRIWRLPRIRIRLRRVIRRVKDKVTDKLKKFKPCLKTVCGLVKNSKNKIVQWACRQVKKLRDEEYPLLSNDETFIEAHEADELVKQGWLKEERRENESP